MQQQAVVLEPGVVYLSPAGRRCRLFVDEAAVKPRKTEATLVNDLPDGTAPASPFAEGFVLSRINWYLLRRAP